MQPADHRDFDRFFRAVRGDGGFFEKYVVLRPCDPRAVLDGIEVAAQHGDRVHAGQLVQRVIRHCAVGVDGMLQSGVELMPAEGDRVVARLRVRGADGSSVLLRFDHVAGIDVAAVQQQRARVVVAAPILHSVEDARKAVLITRFSLKTGVHEAAVQIGGFKDRQNILRRGRLRGQRRYGKGYHGKQHYCSQNQRRLFHADHLHDLIILTKGAARQHRKTGLRLQSCFITFLR